MRVVVDTNVLVSGILFGGIPGQVLDLWDAGRFELVVSPDILTEYERIGAELLSTYPDGRLSFASTLQSVLLRATVVSPPSLEAPVCDDPDDDKFLAAALASGSAVIVSGDRALRRVSGWGGINVLTPRQFLEQHLRRSANG